MKLMISTLLSIAAIAMHLQASSLYTAKDDVTELMPDNFDRPVINDNAIWVVQFYFPWCRHSRSLQPEYKIVATALKGVVKVGAIDTTEHRALAARYRIAVSPVIKIFGTDKISPLSYNGERTAKGIVEAALAEFYKRYKVAESF